MKNVRFYVIRFSNIASFVFFLYVSFFSGEEKDFSYSDAEMPLFMPSPYAFAIWFIIFGLFAVWLARQFSRENRDEELYEKIGFLFPAGIFFTALTSLTGGIYACIYLIIALVISTQIYRVIIREERKSSFFRWPFSIYLGWLSVAVILNIFQVVKGYGISSFLGMGELVWTIIMLVSGGGLSILFIRKNKDLLFPCVFVWAYIAIAIANSDRITVWIPALIISLGLLILIVQHKSGDTKD
ncbi:hypothetical protein CEF21_17795 [Bacillus sp. FJAT-42376]|uniref:tryptophan-rich sensory protein n=1 Tax=Bacillus sp. FJAT-42376 TaxID=2014076 RepID=UPI000F51717D|nr:tryptophan-rich sensory protein [Bacillus sp. FJAT-42376]AZB44018.1 hypothetical protein CEF21_17795 [Bacillus sp. FJAT-42376]